MRCSAVSLVGGGDHSILPSPGRPVPAPACAETLAWPLQEPCLLPKTLAYSQPMGRAAGVVWVAGERWAWQGWLKPAVTGGFGRGLSFSPAIHQWPPLPSWVLAQVKGITKIPAVQTGTPQRLRECLEFFPCPQLHLPWHCPDSSIFPSTKKFWNVQEVLI